MHRGNMKTRVEKEKSRWLKARLEKSAMSAKRIRHERTEMEEGMELCRALTAKERVFRR